MFSSRLIRFLAVGGSNAVLHFTVLNFSFFVWGFHRITASVVATVCAMTYSFLLNRNFVFRSTASIRRQVLSFTAVTASGALLIHNFIYVIFINILDRATWLVDIIGKVTVNNISNEYIIINVATLAGAIVALVWNYNGYRMFVFNNKEAKDEFEEQVDRS